MTTHEHICNCGGAGLLHDVGHDGCYRQMAVISPQPAHGADMWRVDKRVITGYTMREQRGYYQHDCGCWSHLSDSVNSISA
jgi:hypothetical protein